MMMEKKQIKEGKVHARVRNKEEEKMTSVCEKLCVCIYMENIGPFSHKQRTLPLT